MILFGCDEKNDLYKEFDTKKAKKTALEYMNEKYDKDFYVVSSNKNDVNITDSVYKKSLISKLKEDLEEKCFQTFSNDYIRGGIFSFDDDFYSEIQKLNESGNELPTNYEYKAIHEEVFKMQN